MDNKIEVFKNEQFGEIRTALIENEPWFVAVDVCRALEIGNSSQAISRLDADEKMGLLQNRLTKDTGVKGLSLTFCPRVCLYELLFCGNCKAFGRGKADPDSKISAQCG